MRRKNIVHVSEKHSAKMLRDTAECSVDRIDCCAGAPDGRGSDSSSISGDLGAASVGGPEGKDKSCRSAYRL